MTDVWKDIDPTEAEARLRALRRRLGELDDALGAQQAILRENPDSFSFQLACGSLVRRQEDLQAELALLLRHRVNEAIEIALNGAQFHTASASLAPLAMFFIRLQKLYSSIAQAISTGPTPRGPIANAIRNATDLRLAAVYPSSFGMTLYVPSALDLMGHSIAGDALQTMFELFNSGADEKQLMRLSGELGGRTFAHLRHLASSLSRDNAQISLQWNDYTGTEFKWIATTDIANDILRLLENITQTRAEERVLIGRLVGASLVRNRFELLLEDRSLIEGNVVAGLSDALERAFGTTCRVTVNETEILDRGTGDRSTYYVLTAIHDTLGFPEVTA